MSSNQTHSRNIDRLQMAPSGVIILTGPSSCGKGEVSKALCEVLSIPPERSISMGDVLRNTFRQAAIDPSFLNLLENKYYISNRSLILDCQDTNPDLERKVRENSGPLVKMLAQKKGCTSDEIDWKKTSQLEWLEFCTTHGLLVPNRWTQNLVAAHIQSISAQDKGLFILDGYPRTVQAAKHLLETLEEFGIPVSKVLHLSISKQEMLQRAGGRQRLDDNTEALLKRYEFYIEHVQPSVDFLKENLPSHTVALIDAHQPHYDIIGETKKLNVRLSIDNVVQSALLNLGLPSNSGAEKIRLAHKLPEIDRGSGADSTTELTLT